MNRPIRRHGSHSLGRPHAPTVLPEVELQITRGRARNTVRTIGGLAYLIGEAEDNDLVLADEQFPDSHSYLLPQPAGSDALLARRRPGNHGRRSARAVVGLGPPDGSRLRTGPYEFRIRISWPTPAKSAEVANEDFPRHVDSAGDRDGRPAWRGCLKP